MEDERLGNNPEMTAGVCERGQAIPAGSDPPQSKTHARCMAPSPEAGAQRSRPHLCRPASC